MNLENSGSTTTHTSTASEKQVTLVLHANRGTLYTWLHRFRKVDYGWINE